MAVKLYNYSGLPDQPMKQILQEAQRLAGCKGGVIVKVTRGGRAGSEAWPGYYIRRFHLARRENTKAGHPRRGYVKTEGGWIVMRPWNITPLHGAYEVADQFFRVAIHEFAHITDFQENQRRRERGESPLEWSSRMNSGNRPRWAARPEELRAINVTDDALDRLQRQSARTERIHGLLQKFTVQLQERHDRSKN